MVDRDKRIEELEQDRTYLLQAYLDLLHVLNKVPLNRVPCLNHMFVTPELTEYNKNCEEEMNSSYKDSMKSLREVSFFKNSKIIGAE